MGIVESSHFAIKKYFQFNWSNVTNVLNNWDDIKSTILSKETERIVRSGVPLDQVLIPLKKKLGYPLLGIT